MHSNSAIVDERQLTGIRLFAQLDPESLAAIAAGGWTLRHPRAARVVSRGDSLDGLYAVLDGRLKLYMLSCAGTERVLRILQPGDNFGEAIMFNRVPSPVFIDTLSSVQLAYFPRTVIAAALAADPGFTQAMLGGMSVMLRELISDLESCCLQSARQRTVAYLLRRAEADEPSSPQARLPAPKAVVASTLNISAETFSRELHGLQDRGLIAIDKRSISILDRDGLIAAMGAVDAPVTSS